MEYSAYLKSSEWRVTRRHALVQAHYRCQVCCSSRRLEVHHRTYERLGNEMLTDVVVLCADCHGLFHGRLRHPQTTYQLSLDAR